MALETTGLAVTIDSKGAVAGARVADGAFDKLRRGSQRLENRFERLKKSIFNLRTAFIGIASAAVLRKVITEFSAFERGLIGIGKTADLAGAELQRMGVEIQKIARVVPAATTELLAIGQAAGQLGIKGAANIAKFTEVIGKLGLASDLAGEEAATTLARLLTITKTSITDIDRLGASIVDLGNNFAATEAEIARVAIRVARSTSLFGTSAEGVVGLGAAMRSVGVEAEAGGSAVGRAFQAINKAIQGGGAELAALQVIMGDTAANIKKTFEEDSIQSFRRLIEGLGRINDAGGDTSAALKTVGLEGVRIIEVLGSMATRADLVGAALNRSSKAWRENSALNKEVKVASQAFSAQMTLTGNAVDELSVALGAKLAPTLVSVSKAFRNFLNNLTDLVTSNNLNKRIAEIDEQLDILLDKRNDLRGGSGTLVTGLLKGLDAEIKELFARRAGLFEMLARAAKVANTENKKAIDTTKKVADATKTAAAETKAWDVFLKQLLGDLQEDAFTKAAEKFDAVKVSLEEENRQLEDQVRLIRVDKTEREALAVVIEFETALIEAGVKAGTERARVIEQEIRQRAKLRKEIGDTTKAEKLADEQRKRQAELMAEPFKNALGNIQRSFSDFFVDVFEGGVDSFGDLADAIKRIFIRLAAEIATLLVFRPVVGGILGAVGLGGVASGLGVGGLAGGGAGGSGIGIFDALSGASSANNLGLFGNTFSGFGSGITNSINQFGASLGFAGFGGGAGPAAGSFRAAQTVGLTQPGSLSGASLSGVLGAAGIGAFAGGILGDLLGLNSTGSSIGSGLGAGVGFALGGPVGALIGGGVGLLGGLFGGKKPSVGPNAGARLRINEAGEVFQFSSGADNGGDAASAAAFGRDIATAINRLVGSIGGTIGPGGPGGEGIGSDIGQVGNFPKFGGIFAAPGSGASFGGADSFGGQTFGTATDAALFFVKETLKSINLQGVAPEIRTAIKNSAADSLEGLLDDIQFAAALADVDLSENTLTQAEQALAAINDQFTAMTDRAQALGLSLTTLEDARTRAINELIAGFDDAISLQILAFTDPFKLALDNLTTAQETRLKEATALGADLVEVERLSGLERNALLAQQAAEAQRIADQRAAEEARAASDAARAVEDLARAQAQAVQDLANAQSNLLAANDNARSFFSGLIDPLRSSLTDLSTGALSPLSPGDRLAAGQAEFDRLTGLARGGDISAINGLVSSGQNLLGLSRDVNASGPGFASTFTQVNAVLGEVIGTLETERNTLFAEFGLRIEDGLDRQTSTLVVEIKGLRQEMRDVREEVRRLQAA